jgi:pantothenate kinase type III
MSILLIDIGNTRLKWALAPSNGDLHSDFVEQGASMNNSSNQFAQLSNNQTIEKIICSSVISEDQTLVLKKHLQAIMICLN